MVVILFHNNDDILLQKYQKEFISHNITSETLFYAHFPLVCKISDDDFSQEELKSCSKSINTISLDGIAWDMENQSLNCKITLSYMQGETKELFFPLVHSLSKQKKIAENKLIFPATSMFPKTIKTFRLGNQIIINENSSAISASVWH